ncbi:hypothetical protein EGW08_019634, partial [Elysia chlorotica]
HFVTAPLSFLWVYGNLSVYMESYFRFGCRSDCLTSDREWILSVYMATSCPGILLTKMLTDRLGLKWTIVAGAGLVNLCLFGSVWTVQISQACTTFLLGCVLGLANGLTQTACFQYVTAWAPDKSAILMATTTAASTTLSVVQNQVITTIVNPENVRPDVVEGSRTYFSQKNVLDKVPVAFVTYAGVAFSSLQATLYMDDMNSPSTTHTELEPTDKSLKPVEALKTPVFYALYLFVLAIYYALALKANFYKEFALLYIKNDKYLTLCGSLVPVVASIARLVVGLSISNKVTTVKTAIVFSLSGNCVLLSFWYLAPQVSPALYMVFILCLAAAQSLCYVLVPVACAEVFGRTHFSTNYGLALSSLLLLGFLAPLVISSLMQTLGWQWIFQSSSMMCAVALVLVV